MLYTPLQAKHLLFWLNRLKFHVSVQTHNLEKLSAKIDVLLSDMSDAEPIPQAVALAAGRYAAMQLFQMHGRAHAM